MTTAAVFSTSLVVRLINASLVFGIKSSPAGSPGSLRKREKSHSGLRPQT